MPLVPPKAEGIGDGNVDFRIACFVGAVVQIATGFNVLFKDVDGWWRFLLVYCQHTIQRFHATGCAEQVAGHRFGRVNDDFARMIA